MQELISGWLISGCVFSGVGGLIVNGSLEMDLPCDSDGCLVAIF